MLNKKGGSFAQGQCKKSLIYIEKKVIMHNMKRMTFFFDTKSSIKYKKISFMNHLSYGFISSPPHSFLKNKLF